MITFGLILMVIGPILFALGGYYLYKYSHSVISMQCFEGVNFKKEYIFAGSFSLLAGVGLLLFCMGVPLYWSYPMQPYEWACVVIGGLLLGFELGVVFYTFMLHFYQTKLPNPIDKIIFYTMVVTIPLIVFTLWLLTEGYANHLAYPLVNGISWQGGLHWATAKTKDTNIAWYAFCILTGAIYVYYICDHHMYKEFGKHGLLDSTFLIAFPAGIIGARIAYVIGNWDLEFAKDPWSAFAIWNGGLTILGGAIGGIVVGVLWFHHKHKDIPVGKAVNLIVPAILFAQAVGRWGNFFNCEVHGIEMSGESWGWLPTFIYKQMEYSHAAGPAAPGNIYVPLFLIEMGVNLVGYFVLNTVFGKYLGKYIKNWDLCFGYVAWYGATRVFMEPLRHPSYNMGNDGAWSWVWSIIFIGVGLLAIIINHIYRYIKQEKQNPTALNQAQIDKYRTNSIIGLTATFAVSAILIGVGFALFATNTIPEGALLISLCAHNIGMIMWIVGLCVAPSMLIPIMFYMKTKKTQVIQED